MADLSWLSEQAHTLHSFFYGIFYLLVTVFLVLGVIIEYFKMPLGSTPGFSVLVGRALIAVILLHTFPEVSQIFADLSDAVARQIGDLNQFHVVLEKMGEQVSKFSWSWVTVWTNVKGSILLLLSLLTFALLYLSVYVAQAFLLFTWTLTYVLSPILTALFVLPQTASATHGLYRSLIEASCWKILWAVMATLLWSTGVSDLHQSNIITGICFNLILAGSLLMTPMVVHQIISGGIAAMAGSLGSIAIPGVGAITTGGVLGAASLAGRRMFNSGHSGASALAAQHFPSASRYIDRIPRWNVPEKKPLMVMPAKRECPRPMNAGERANYQVYGVKPPDIAKFEKKHGGGK